LQTFVLRVCSAIQILTELVFTLLYEFCYSVVAFFVALIWFGAS
jgi:hypothetical protein